MASSCRLTSSEMTWRPCGPQNTYLQLLQDSRYEELWAELLGGFAPGEGEVHGPDGTRVPTGTLQWPLPVAGTQWKGRKVAFMGDSITDKAHVGTTKNYWQYLQEMLGLVPFVYGINGQQWRDVPGQCERLRPSAAMTSTRSDLCRDERLQFRDASGDVVYDR